MSKMEAKNRIDHLKKTINKHRYEYHVYDRSLISEAALDSLKKELFELEEKFPDLVTPDSPTQRIGGEPLTKFKKITRSDRMHSLNDAFSEDDVYGWLERTENYLKRPLKDDEKEFYCDLKMDGLAIELIYNDGVLQTAATRGDGLIGEDVTQNIRTVEAIPLKLNQESRIKNQEFPKRLIVRGEIFLSKKEFARINRDQEKKEEKSYANPRNVAAGAIRQLDPKITAGRKLDFFAYGIQEPNFKNLSDEHATLKSFGIKSNPHGITVRSVKEIINFKNKWEKKREKLPYEIDGVVISFNNINLYDELGIVGKAPRGAIAYKFAAKEATTVIEEIKVQVGRTGKLTPVAIMRPVPVGGITVTHASLHNADEIERLDIKIGDTVIISRAGDVIPQVKEVLKEMRTGKEKKFEMPQKCPIDNSKVVRDGVLHRCSNKNCGARRREQLYHFVSRGAFNLEGLGPKIIDRFMDEGLISTATDIFKLEKGDIEVLERFGEKSAENIVREVSEKKIVTLPRFLYALGILHVGEETAVLLAQQLTTHNLQPTTPVRVLRAFQKMSLDDLQGIRDVGPKVSQSIYDWFQEKRNVHLLEELGRAGIRIKNQESRIKDAKFAGLTFVLTGTLESMSRDEAKKKIRDLGGNVSSSVSKKTNCVVVGTDPGSKAGKAKKLGVKILNETEFRKLLVE
jgi:DNA ligase (NAD+)